MRTLEWVKANELPTGGIAAWPGMVAYPEVTGYLIPTLYEWGAEALAERCADWLVSIQHPSGGYPSIDGSDRLHVFDTAAVLQGMDRAFWAIGDDKYWKCGQAARKFILSHLGDRSRFDAWTGAAPRQYCVRVNGILGIDTEFVINWNDRVHFIAYALEGYLALGHISQVREALQSMPMRSDGLAFFMYRDGVGYGDDIIATAQIAILRRRCGLDAGSQMDAVRRHLTPSGGVPQSTTHRGEKSWGAKFYLDLERIA